MEIILVRHAESDANVKLLYSGTQDSPLTSAGIKQVDKLARHLAQTLTQVNAVYSSSQTRAIQTAQAISHNLFIGEPIVDPQLNEISFGDWEGLTADQIESRYPGQLQIWESDPELSQIPNSESLESATNRIYSFCQEKYDQDPESRIIVVTHGVVIRCLLVKLLMRTLRDIWMFDIDNAGYSIINWEKSHALVVQINEVKHLELEGNIE